MGSTASQRAAVEPGKTLIADVISTGELMYAPRTLRLLVASSSVCVRDPGGRLIWLETDTTTAFAGPHGSVREYAHADEKSGLLPRDTAAEATALVSVPAVLAWCVATLHPGRRPADPKQYENRAADIRMATTDEGRQLQITVDRDTGVVLAISGKSLRGDFKLKLQSVRVVERTPDHFIAQHL